jgi:RNA polymerase sigma-70 factor (ECF subfamily)
LNEQLLIQKILQGDTASFRYLYRLYALSAMQLAMSVCKQKENAEEVVQNSFINAYNNLGNFRQESTFKTWLLRIVFNEAIRIQKAEQKYLWQEMTQDENGEEIISICIPNTIDKKETKEQVTKTIASLSEKESIVLNLFYLEELSIKETADVLGYTESNVKVLLHRARKNFKNVYEKL